MKNANKNSIDIIDKELERLGKKIPSKYEDPASDRIMINLMIVFKKDLLRSLNLLKIRARNVGSVIR